MKETPRQAPRQNAALVISDQSGNTLTKIELQAYSRTDDARSKFTACRYSDNDEVHLSRLLNDGKLLKCILKTTATTETFDAKFVGADVVKNDLGYYSVLTLKIVGKIDEVGEAHDFSLYNDFVTRNSAG